MHRRELSDAQYAQLDPLLPEPRHRGPAGRPWLPHRAVPNGIPRVLRAGAPRRDPPERYGRWNTVSARFNRGRRDGTWARLLATPPDHRDDQGRLDHDLWCIDGTVVRAAGGARRHPRRRPRLDDGVATQLGEPEDHAPGYPRGGFGTKAHLLCDSHGTVVGAHVTPGRRHESTAFGPTMQRAALRRRRGRRRRPRRLAGDEGYSSPRIRRWLGRRRIGRVIPTRAARPRDPGVDKVACRKRNIIERAVGRSKECRRLRTRFETLAVSYVAFRTLASTVRLL